jgi:putative ABC transport system permease protein
MIGWAGLATSLILVLVAIGISLQQRLHLERTLVWTTIRSGVQLLAVGAALQLVLAEDAPLALAWSWVVLMVGIAGVTVGRRAREVPGVVGLAFAAIGTASVVSLGVVFGLGIFEMSARTIIPLAGMQVGNAMAASVTVARRLVGELADKRPEVEARLALGLGWPEAARPHVRNALTTGLTPMIEQTKALGIIALPGTMTGLILAGTDPGDAVRLQLAVMYVLLGSVATASTVVALGLTRRLFTADHRLVPLLRR